MTNYQEARVKLINTPLNKLKSAAKIKTGDIFIDKKLAIKVIMDCKATLAHKFRTRVEFKQDDIIFNPC